MERLRKSVVPSQNNVFCVAAMVRLDERMTLVGR